MSWCVPGSQARRRRTSPRARSRRSARPPAGTRRRWSCASTSACPSPPAWGAARATPPPRCASPPPPRGWATTTCSPRARTDARRRRARPGAARAVARPRRRGAAAGAARPRGPAGGARAAPRAPSLHRGRVRTGRPRGPRARTRRKWKTVTARSPQALAEGAPLPPAALLHNDLQDAARALCPEIDAALAEAREQDADAALVSGSGPTVLGLFAGSRGPARARAATRALAERVPAPLAAEPVTAQDSLVRL